MAIDYIITSALNLSQDQVQSLSTTRNHGTLNIYLLLINKHPICPYCGADTSSKGLLTYTFKTQDIAGLKTIVNLKEEYLNSFRRPYDDRKQSNALSEFMNSRLRVLINVSNGLANFPRFRARALYALNTKLYYTITNHLQSSKRIGMKRGSYKK